MSEAGAQVTRFSQWPPRDTLLLPLRMYEGTATFLTPENLSSEDHRAWTGAHFARLNQHPFVKSSMSCSTCGTARFSAHKGGANGALTTLPDVESAMTLWGRGRGQNVKSACVDKVDCLSALQEYTVKIKDKIEKRRDALFRGRAEMQAESSDAASARDWNFSPFRSKLTLDDEEMLPILDLPRTVRRVTMKDVGDVDYKQANKMLEEVEAGKENFMTSHFGAAAAAAAETLHSCDQAGCACAVAIEEIEPLAGVHQAQLALPASLVVHFKEESSAVT